MFRALLAAAIWGAMGASVFGSVCLVGAEAPEVGAISAGVRGRLGLSDFYVQGTVVGGVPVVASGRVSPYAVKEAAWILGKVTAVRPEILETMAGRGAYVVVMAHDEYTTDIPEHSGLKPRIYWDRRARGLGGIPVSCAEENLLCFPGDPYEKENILIHEFAHGMHSEALRAMDSTFQERLEAAYEEARAAGRWAGTYAMSNPAEYWAEAVQSWFDDNRQNDALHNHVNTRAELKAYDPALAKLCAEALGEGAWRYRRPPAREAGDRAHLAGYDFDARPRFRWREEAVGRRPLVRFETALGNFEVELEAERAPATTANFVRYVHEGYYNDGQFYRTVRGDNQAEDAVAIAVVQGRADPSRGAEEFDAIALERTCDTGLRHLDGTLSMARTGPDTATHEFFLCIGDQPELDFGGRRNPDGQGFAAFGRVVKGMDVVRAIHGRPAEGQALTPVVPIQRAIRMR